MTKGKETFIFFQRLPKLVVLGALTLFICTTCFVIGGIADYHYWQDRHKVFNSTLLYPQLADKVQITAQLTTVDFSTNKYEVMLTPTVHGNYSDSTGAPLGNLTINYDQNKQLYPQGFELFDYAISAQFDSGYISSYPLDQWNATVTISATINDTSVPLEILVLTDMPSYNLWINANLSDPSQSTYTVSLVVGRTAIDIFYSIILTVLVWCVTAIYLFAIFMTYMESKHLKELSILGATMIFAMKSVRDMQPNVPEDVCGTDIFGFFWCTLLQSCGFLASLIRWVFGYIKKLDENEPKTPGEPCDRDAAGRDIEKAGTSREDNKETIALEFIKIIRKVFDEDIRPRTLRRPNDGDITDSGAIAC